MAEELHQDDRAAFRAAMQAALGPDARLYSIVAKGGFAVRNGPLTLAECDDLVEWAKEEHVPLMITADCGALPDRNLLASLFGDTRDERASLAKERLDFGLSLNACMLTTAHVLDELICGHSNGTVPTGRLAVDLVSRIREASLPVEVLQNRMRNEERAIQGLTKPGLEDDDAAPLHDTREDDDPPADGAVSSDKAQLLELERILPRASRGASLADRAELLMQMIGQVSQRADKIEDAVRWVLGESEDDFDPKSATERYWWRKELRQRAFGDRPSSPAFEEAILRAIPDWLCSEGVGSLHARVYDNSERKMVCQSMDANQREEAEKLAYVVLTAAIMMRDKGLNRHG